MRARDWQLRSAALCALLIASRAHAEGTAQLGAGQDVLEITAIRVDVRSAGEVINVHVGNDSATDTTPIALEVLDPDGTPVTGSPFTIAPGSPGWLPRPNVVPTAADTVNPLQITAQKTGNYALRFDNQRVFANDIDAVIDPLDITVT